MENLNRKYPFELLIYKTFVKTVKKYNLYHYVIMTIGFRGCKSRKFYKAIFQSLLPTKSELVRRKVVAYGSPYPMVASLEDMLKLMRRYELNDTKDKMFQMKVMTAVNDLIHFTIEPAFIETHSGDLKVIEKIGNEIFNEVCTKLFGEDFKDETSMPIDENMNPNDNFMGRGVSLPPFDRRNITKEEFEKILANYNSFASRYMKDEARWGRLDENQKDTLELYDFLYNYPF